MSSRLFAFLRKTDGKVHRFRGKKIGLGEGTAKGKKIWVYLRKKERIHVSQEKQRIPVRHPRLRRPYFKEKDLRAQQGK